MKLGLQDVDWEYVAARLAKTCDNEQAEFFKAFAKECYPLAGVNRLLTTAEKETLRMLSCMGGE